MNKVKQPKSSGRIDRIKAKETIKRLKKSRE